MGATRPFIFFFDASTRSLSNFCLGVSGFFVRGDDLGLSTVYRTGRSSSRPEAVMTRSVSTCSFFFPYLSTFILPGYGLGNPLLVIHLYVCPNASIQLLAAAV